jgi:hypothetical protein
MSVWSYNKSDHVAESCRYLLMANHKMRYTFQG